MSYTIILATDTGYQNLTLVMVGDRISHLPLKEARRRILFGTKAHAMSVGLDYAKENGIEAFRVRAHYLEKED